nr:MAG TPA: hypothetical protein [Caudoviricetes sp.]
MNNLTVLLLKRPSEFDTPRACARPHTRVLPPDGVRGKDASCVGSGIYVYM